MRLGTLGGSHGKDCSPMELFAPFPGLQCVVHGKLETFVDALHEATRSNMVGRCSGLIAAMTPTVGTQVKDSARRAESRCCRVVFPQWHSYAQTAILPRYRAPSLLPGRYPKSGKVCDVCDVLSSSVGASSAPQPRHGTASMHHLVKPEVRHHSGSAACLQGHQHTIRPRLVGPRCRAVSVQAATPRLTAVMQHGGCVVRSLVV
ncbi:hypothetical protein F5Y15DRAFT_107417 [Xylariaceae sp. FL0016]|nr:hypothetical protein F5Y15DRAFT_107417 [Xylariaceae sp. FL0016]